MGYGVFFAHLQQEAIRRGEPLSVLLSAAKDLGVDRVTESVDRLPEILPHVTEAGMKVNIVYCVSRLVQGEDLVRNLQAAEMTAKAGGSSLMLVPGFYENGLTDEDALRNSVPLIKQIVQACRSLGIHVAIEDYGGKFTPYSTVPQIVNFLDAADGLEFVFDSGNILYHKQDPLALWDATEDRIVGIHAKDLALTGREEDSVLTPAGERLYPTAFGAGALPGAELCRRIAKKGIVPEKITFEHDRGGAPDSLEFLRRSVAFFKNRF